MNASECKRQAMMWARVPVGREGESDLAADRWLSEYVDRDSTLVPGTVLVDEIDPETLEHRTVERVLHAPRLVKPFAFGHAEVRDLANHLRRELRLR